MNKHTQIIEKMNDWIGFCELIRNLAGEEASHEADDEYISDIMGNLIEQAIAAHKRDNTHNETTITFHHKSGNAVEFVLGFTLMKEAGEDEGSLRGMNPL